MNHTALLIDDDQSVLQGLVRALHRQPYQIYTATSGEEAMLVLKAHNVDVVVSDEHMPGMCGGELLAWVAEQFPEVMRIVLTGHPTVDAAIRAINEGRVYQFFTKPCNPAQLGVSIRKALEHKDLLREYRQLVELNRRYTKDRQRLDDRLQRLADVLGRDVRESVRSIAGRYQAIETQYPRVVAPADHDLLRRAQNGLAVAERLLGELNVRGLATAAAGEESDFALETIKTG